MRPWRAANQSRSGGRVRTGAPRGHPQSRFRRCGERRVSQALLSCSSAVRQDAAQTERRGSVPFRTRLNKFPKYVFESGGDGHPRVISRSPRSCAEAVRVTAPCARLNAVPRVARAPSRLRPVFSGFLVTTSCPLPFSDRLRFSRGDHGSSDFVAELSRCSCAPPCVPVSHLYGSRVRVARNSAQTRASDPACATRAASLHGSPRACGASHMLHCGREPCAAHCCDAPARAVNVKADKSNHFLNLEVVDSSRFKVTFAVCAGSSQDAGRT